MWWDGIHGFYGSVVVIVIGSSRVIRRARVRKSAYHWAPSARVVSRHCSGGGQGTSTVWSRYITRGHSHVVDKD